MKMRTACATLALLAGCSTGVVQTGDGTYMIAQHGSGVPFANGSYIKGGIYSDATAFCAKDGKVVETIKATSANAIPFARMPQAELNFKCVAPAPAAASAPQ